MANETKNQIINTLHATVQKYVPADQQTAMERYLTSIMSYESAGKCAAKNSQSSACGLFQFIDKTWNHYEPGKDKSDVAAQCDAAVRFAMDNAATVQRAVGHTPSAGEYYLLHFLGPGDGAKVLRADDSTLISSLMTGEHGVKVMQGNAGITYQGKRFRDFTVGDLKNMMNYRMEGKAFAVRNTYGVDDSDPEQQDMAKDLLKNVLGMSDERVASFMKLSGFGKLLISLLEGFLNSTKIAEPEKPIGADIVANDSKRLQVADADQTTIAAPAHGRFVLPASQTPRVFHALA